MNCWKFAGFTVRQTHFASFIIHGDAENTVRAVSFASLHFTAYQLIVRGLDFTRYDRFQFTQKKTKIKHVESGKTVYFFLSITDNVVRNKI